MEGVWLCFYHTGEGGNKRKSKASISDIIPPARLGTGARRLQVTAGASELPKQP